MISILIPVFNYDVNILVTDLSFQLVNLQKGGEIIIMDDGSDAFYQSINAKIASAYGVKYILSEKNHGRMLIRKKLAALASFDHLLFLDADSKIISSAFLSNYFSQLQQGSQVVVGGRKYTDAPSDCAFHLHWKYGITRETINKSRKNKDPYTGFMSNNFLIAKEVFQQIKFEPRWEGYGHEDTFIGIQLETKEITIRFINNEIIHDGLEIAEKFISKSENALRNLLLLSNVVPTSVVKRHVKLYRYYSLLHTLKLTRAYQFFYRPFSDIIKRKITSCNPSLACFDLYRLNYFIQIREGSIAR